ncbi:Cytidylate kinase [uncultured spirochete]|jgi:cytidylate kinase|uniref:Cytidylate kinase n=1 Tax=uncultured spirochete TaxID=156406 RepID=A0A3P3XTN5_9SPIR|nr:Cytidylate kinase [uncultured spirochete]
MWSKNTMGIIAISGKSGCGNTTVLRLVAEKLGFEPVNYTFRSMAIDMGISFEELLKRAQESLEYDRRLDEHQAMLARKGNTVIGSRLAIWMVPEADLKVYLKASHAVRVQRIHAREGGDMASIERFTRERDAKDRDRYLTLYNIDIDDISCAHLVIDTERWSASKVAEIIADAYNIAK